MIQIAVQNLREEPRYLVIGRIDAHLISPQGRLIQFFPLDVSQNGLGLLVNERLSVGSCLKLEINPDSDSSQVIPLTVVWSTTDRAHRNPDFVYRIGARINMKRVNLKSLLEQQPLCLIIDQH